jgi:pilus assembly protein CpaB
MIAFLLAVVLAGGATYLLYKRLRGSAAQTQVTQVVAAAKDLPPGVALTPDDLSLVDWPANVPLPGSFNKKEAVVGRPLIYGLGAKEPVLDRDLAVPGSGIGLSVKIPPGMRATAVRSNEIVGVAGFLYPGSHVDVLVTYNPPGGFGPLTQTVLQDVEVVTAGQRIEPDPQGKPQTVNVVTLLLSPEDSQKMLLSGAQGQIQFVLRNGADTKKLEDLRPTTLAELLTGVKAPVAAAGHGGRARKARPPKIERRPDVYVVEVIKGEKRTEEKF